MRHPTKIAALLLALCLTLNGCGTNDDANMKAILSGYASADGASVNSTPEAGVIRATEKSMLGSSTLVITLNGKAISEVDISEVGGSSCGSVARIKTLRMIGDAAFAWEKSHDADKDATTTINGWSIATHNEGQGLDARRRLIVERK